LKNSYTSRLSFAEGKILANSARAIASAYVLMKILFLYDFPLWGTGSGTYIRNLIQELVKLNHKIGIIAPDERRFLEDKLSNIE